jgi:hypothetical protein
MDLIEDDSSDEDGDEKNSDSKPGMVLVQDKADSGAGLGINDDVGVGGDSYKKSKSVRVMQGDKVSLNVNDYIKNKGKSMKVSKESFDLQKYYETNAFAGKFRMVPDVNGMHKMRKQSTRRAAGQSIYKSVAENV